MTGFPTNQVTTIWRGADMPDLLPEGLEFTWRGGRFRHRPGGYTDGMSSPQFVQCLPMIEARGWAMLPAVAHDGGYHRAIEIYSDGEWKPFVLSKDDCDAMFYDLLLCVAGDDFHKRHLAKVFFDAVHFFGRSAYDAGGREIPS